MRIALLANPDNLHVRRWIDFLRGRGHDLLLIADPHTTARPEGVAVRLPQWGFFTNVLAFRLTPKPHGNSRWKHLHYRPIIREFAPDVVHGFEAYYNGLATARSGPFPKVLTPWGMDIHRDGVGGGMAARMVKEALRGVERITTNDETLAEFLHVRFGVPKERVVAFSWGIDLDVFRPGLDAEAAQWRERLGIEPKARVVLSPRVFDPYWGADEIADAAARLARERPGAAFVILAAGADPGFLAEMKRRIEQAGAGASVRWIEDRLDPTQMAALFNMADVYVSIPKTDLLAMTVLEGMACGCFPVLANHAAYAKHAEDGRNALMLDQPTGEQLAEAIGRALGDDDLRRRAAQFNTDRMRRTEDAAVNMLRIEDVYDAAIAAYRV